MRPPRRPGLSLTEVLVAMFVMALGLMALLTLFPLGAMQIGQALKDDRTAQTAQLGDAWVRVWWKDAVAPYANDPNALPAETLLAALDDPNVDGTGTAQINPGQFNAYFRVPAQAPNSNTHYLLPSGTALQPATAGNDFVLPRSGLLRATIVTGATTPPAPNTDRFVSVQSRTAAGSGSSYPVLIDPLGSLARSAATRIWVGRDSVGTTGGVYGTNPAATPLLLPRRNTAATTLQNVAFAACALTDDLTYQPNGGSGQATINPDTGVKGSPEPLNRQGRYHWAALVQRPDNSQPDRASLTVLVFDGRPAFLAAAGDEVVLTNDVPNSVVYFAGATAGSRSLTLNVPTRGADQAPLARRGGWVAIVSMDAPGVTNAVRGVSFHRITGLTAGDDTTQPQYAGGPTVTVTPVAVDLDPPLPTRLSANPQVLLLAGLSEVFERPILTGY